MNFHIRKMEESDLNDVFAIEIIDNPHHWTKQIIQDCIRVKYDCFVCEDESNQKIIGFAILSHAVDESHILNIAISKPYRRQGIAQHFLQYLYERCKANQIPAVLLEVRESNKPAIELYLKNKFKQIGIRKDYYPAEGGRENALVLKKILL